MSEGVMLWGWVDLEGKQSPPGCLEKMLAADGSPQNGLTIHGPGATLAGGSPSVWLAQDGESSCLAALLGAPRWRDESSARQAREQGHAQTLLARYRAVGEDVVLELQGGYALVVVDPARSRVLLAVDRLGIERLCFARVGSTLVFSTSAGAVANHPAVGGGISPQALYEYLYCHMVPSPDTVFRGVEKLQPAQRLIATRDGLQRDFYWTLRYAPDPAIAESRQREVFKDLLRQGVARQLDGRPAGAFLSGGTDSSTVAGLLGAVGGQPAQTFSIGFQAEGFDEMEYARITARHFGTDSHEFYVTPEHVAEAMPLIAAAYDEPFGNASAVPTYFCARLAREHGVQVMLAGDGGDEFFGGNVRYAKQGVFEHYGKLPRVLRAMLEASLLRLPPDAGPALLRKARSYVSQARIPLPDRLESYNFLHREPLTTLFEPDFLAAVDVDRPLALMGDAYQRCTSSNLVDRMMHLDHKFTLADNDLRKVTTMCRAAGIDVRFPLLDEDLIAFSGTLSGPQKVAGDNLRVFFKDALGDYLPRETITKSKHGFGLPFGLWLAQDGALRDLAETAMKSFARRGILRQDYLDGLWQAHRGAHASYYGVMIWVLVQLELWLQNHGVGA